MATTTISSTPPTTFLAHGVTDLNRQTLWAGLSDADKAKFSVTSNSTSSGSSTSTTAKKFVSNGNAAQVTPLAFNNRTDARSATPTAATLTGFGSLWAGDAALQAQLTLNGTGTAAVNGGAIFVDVALGTVAGGTRPDNGANGLASNARGANPYGYFSADPALSATPFVQTVPQADGSLTETTFAASGASDYTTWLKTSKYRYDDYEGTINQAMSNVTATFGTTQGLLGFDVNNNGYIDNESELFGFDGGLNLDNMPPGATSANPFTITSSANKYATESFTFLNADGRLNGDPLDTGQTADLAHYRRFMTLGADGASTSLLQSDLSYSAATSSYIKSQAMFSFVAGKATLTAVAQAGFSVTA